MRFTSLLATAAFLIPTMVSAQPAPVRDPLVVRMPCRAVAAQRDAFAARLYGPSRTNYYRAARTGVQVVPGDRSVSYVVPRSYMTGVRLDIASDLRGVCE